LQLVHAGIGFHGAFCMDEMEPGATRPVEYEHRRDAFNVAEQFRRLIGAFDDGEDRLVSVEKPVQPLAFVAEPREILELVDRDDGQPFRRVRDVQQV